MIHILIDKLKKTELEEFIMSNLKGFKTEVGLEVVGADIMTVYDPKQDTAILNITYKYTIVLDIQKDPTYITSVEDRYCTQKFKFGYDFKIKGITFKQLQDTLDKYFKNL